MLLSIAENSYDLVYVHGSIRPAFVPWDNHDDRACGPWIWEDEMIQAHPELACEISSAVRCYMLQSPTRIGIRYDNPENFIAVERSIARLPLGVFVDVELVQTLAGVNPVTARVWLALISNLRGLRPVEPGCYQVCDRPTPYQVSFQLCVGDPRSQFENFQEVLINH